MKSKKITVTLTKKQAELIGEIICTIVDPGDDTSSRDQFLENHNGSQIRALEMASDSIFEASQNF